MSRLGIGAIIPNDGPEAGQLGITRMAAVAEAAGATSLWVSDHLLFVDEPTTDYPYSDDGVPTWPSDVDCYEALTSCMAMAMVTERCRIGTAILVLPQRNVLEVAKVAATVDRLSGGRLDLGVGAGWSSKEFEALGYDFASRGRRFDEMLEVLHDCWSGRPAPYDGGHVRVPPNVVLHPRPAQPAGPPLLVGGMAPVARRRAARHGDGWLAIAFVDRWDRDELGRMHAGVLERRGDLRRDRPFTTVLKLHAVPEEVEAVPAMAADAFRIGFGEVIVEPPWSAGMDAASQLIERSIAATAGVFSTE